MAAHGLLREQRGGHFLDGEEAALQGQKEGPFSDAGWFKKTIPGHWHDVPPLFCRWCCFAGKVVNVTIGLDLVLVRGDLWPGPGSSAPLHL